MIVRHMASHTSMKERGPEASAPTPLTGAPVPPDHGAEVRNSVARPNLDCGCVSVVLLAGRRCDNGGRPPGTRDSDDWQGFVPAALVPQVQDPGRGFLLSANHRPIGSFYPAPLGTSTGSMGDTMRSWRLRERLTAKERFSPADVLEVHDDSVNPARRDMVRLGLHLHENQPEVLSDASVKALHALEKWLAAGASSDLKSENAELATKLSTFFRFVVTPLARSLGSMERRERHRKDGAQRADAGNAAWGTGPAVGLV